MKEMVTPSGLDLDDDVKGNWIQTYTGRPFYPFDPQRSEVHIEDIAHALSHTCRFTGHCEVLYTVAQHCVLASQLVEPGLELEALLHDASEAYLTDVPSPVKAGLPDYKALEKRILQRIFQEFGLRPTPDPLPFSEAPEVKHVDLLLVATEARDLMANPPTMWRLPVAPLSGLKIDPWDAPESKRQYLRRFEELTRRTS